MSYDKTGYECFRILDIRRASIQNEITGLAFFVVGFAKYPHPSRFSTKHYTATDELDVLGQIQKDPTVLLLPEHVPFPGIDT